MSVTIPTSWITFEFTHDEGKCGGQQCVIHNQSDHHMRLWRLHWRDDRGIFERICVHGVGHPDPDQFDYWRVTNQEWQRIHGCCGCCGEGDDEASGDDYEFESAEEGGAGVVRADR